MARRRAAARVRPRGTCDVLDLRARLEDGDERDGQIRRGDAELLERVDDGKVRARREAHHPDIVRPEHRHHGRRQCHQDVKDTAQQFPMPRVVAVRADDGDGQDDQDGVDDL